MDNMARNERNPYQNKNNPPNNDKAADKTMLRPKKPPTPNTPKLINIKSHKKQMSETQNMWFLSKPCLSTNAFCAPIAMMSPPEIIAPLSMLDKVIMCG